MLNIWTDGSCYYKDRKGGWAFVIVKGDDIIFGDTFYQEDTTSARMEMRAVYEALKYCNENYSKTKFQLNTDYEVMTNCINKRWYLRWEECEWYDVKNSDLWKKIVNEYHNPSRNKFIFNKVRGHDGILFNEVVDQLAGEARNYLK